MRGAADRVDDPWELDDDSAALRADIEDDGAMELALLAYAQRSAARTGAEWFAAEFARREDEERRQRNAQALWQPAVVEAQVDEGLVDDSVADDGVGGTPSGLGIPAPPPVMRHPHVPRPPVVEDPPEPKKGRRKRETPIAVSPPPISAPEWARMSPGARRLYGVDEPST
jgi:hypothetical protein